MAKRITVDAKIVLERAGYHVDYVYENGRVIGLDVWAKPFEFVKKLPVDNGSTIDNNLIEELINRAA